MELTLDQALKKGIEAHKSGKVQEADRYYTAILKENPKHPYANHNMGVLATGVGKVETALPFFKVAIDANPSIAQFWLSYIDALIKLDRIDDAKVVFDQAKNKEIKGKSISADINEDTYSIGSSKIYNSTNNDAYIYVLKNNTLQAKLSIKDNIKTNTQKVLNDINNKGYNTSLLSGDNLLKCQAIANEIGINKIYAEKLHEENSERFTNYS